MSASAFPPALGNGPLREVFEDVFLVEGQFVMRPLVHIGRNMVVVRRGDALTVINSVRLTEEGDRQLEALGRVTDVVRLGAFHRADDPWYVHRFGARLWALPEVRPRHRKRVTTDRELKPGGELPVDGELFVFSEAAYSEAALLLRQPVGEGTLVVCDAIVGNVPGRSLLAKLAIRLMTPRDGRLAPGPLWLKAMQEGGRSLEPDYRRLLELEFRHFIAAHGPPRHDDAMTLVRDTVERMYGVGESEAGA